VKPLPKTGKTIAIDLGLTNFIKTNEDETYYHPKPYRTAKEKLSYLNRKLASKQKGSNNRKKLKIRLARAHEKVANIRLDFQHKMANVLLKKYDKIILEDLNLMSMLTSEEYNVKKSNILDAAFGQFVSILTYKAERADKLLKFVSPVNTSKRCSKCGKLKENLTLHDRTYHCEYCGLEIDRDLNAALNIFGFGTKP
jgi:putative transposase